MIDVCAARVEGLSPHEEKIGEADLADLIALESERFVFFDQRRDRPLVLRGGRAQRLVCRERTAHFGFDVAPDGVALGAVTGEARVRNRRRFLPAMEEWQRDADAAHDDAVTFLFLVRRPQADIGPPKRPCKPSFGLRFGDLGLEEAKVGTIGGARDQIALRERGHIAE